MILITGINGEMGHALTKQLHDANTNNIIGLDIKKASLDIAPLLKNSYIGDIRDKKLIHQIF